MQQAMVQAPVTWSGGVDDTSIVPANQVTVAPLVAVHKFIFGCVVQQALDESSPLFS